MSWGAVVAGGAALIGGALSSSGSKSAANAQARANDAAIAEQRRQFDLTREDTAPYRQIGTQALGALGSIYGYSTPVAGYSGDTTPGVDSNSGYRINPDGSVSQAFAAGGSAGSPDYSNFFASPDYQFRKDQGMQGIERSLAARGLATSGNALSALADYNSNLAAGEFGNYFNRQAALAGIGQSAVNTATQAGANSASNIGNYFQNSGAARASGIASSSNAWGNALGTIGGIAYNRWGPQQ